MFSKLLTPDTVDYMIAGYVVITLGIGIYIASLVFRWKKTVKAYLQFKNDLDQ
jgi:hypothetical protein